jgi:glycosyltransferase involved in cell wall biosynthesis
VLELGKTPGVVVTGTVPVLSEYIRAAEVYVSPLRFGAGVKNKILEAMATDVPIVATPISLSGTPLVSGRHLLVAEKPAEIAQAVTKIFQQPDLAASLTGEALSELQARYTWDRIADQFDAIYSSLVG